MDAYRFASDLIRKADRRIVLIDNYVDDTVLSLLDKRKEGVSATIYTKSITDQFQLDIKRHNEQYASIEVRCFNKAHDRFLLIDDEVYHIGASNPCLECIKGDGESERKGTTVIVGVEGRLVDLSV